MSAEFEDKPEELTEEPREVAISETQLELLPPAEVTQKKRVSSLVQLDIPHDSLDVGLGLGLEQEFDRLVEAQKVEFERSLNHLYYPFSGRFPSAELPASRGSMVANPMANVPSLPKPLDSRVLPRPRAEVSHRGSIPKESSANRSPNRQRGYLMRQNTKIVVASERNPYDESRSPGLPATHGEDSLAPQSPNPNHVQASPRKTSQPTWTAEPWNGKMRRKSIRVGGEKAVSYRRPGEGPVPPLPGQVSNAQQTLDAVAEDELGEDDDFEDGAERGRLFVKVVGVKDLQMPFPQRKPKTHSTRSSTDA
jgi:hypothetical protein